MNLIIKAAAFARLAHEGQRRKYTSRPYVEHPARVAGRVAAHPRATEAMVAAAFLHDVVEDTPRTLAEIAVEFCPEVAGLVAELTNPSKSVSLPRWAKKHLDHAHLATVSREAKIIKLLDRIDNLRDMSGAPNGVLQVYCAESRQLVAVIGDADPELADELLGCVAELEGAKS